MLRSSGPGTDPTACALGNRCCALGGWQGGVPGRGAPRLCEGRLALVAHPTPAACLWGRQSGSAAHQRILAACAKDGQQGEDERLSPDAPDNGATHLTRRRPPATPTARNAGSQERTLWGRCWFPTPAPRRHRQRDPATRLKDGWPGGGERVTPDAPNNRERSPPPGQPPATPAARDTQQHTQAKGVGSPHQHTRAHSPLPTGCGRGCVSVGPSSLVHCLACPFGRPAPPGVLGGSSCRCEGRLRLAALPPPAARL